MKKRYDIRKLLHDPHSVCELNNETEHQDFNQRPM